VLVVDRVTRSGTTVRVFFAVTLGLVTVYSGPTVETKMETDTTVRVSIGVEVIVRYLVGVLVTVACGPTVR
jgi:hypothetical protein